MPTPKRLYEGPDPDKLLNDILKDHGSSVVISKPELVRKGGVLGFFATSHYRVEVRPKIAHTDTQRVPVGALAGVRGALDALVDGTNDTLQLSSRGHSSFESVLEDVAGSLGEEPSQFNAPPFVPEPSVTERSTPTFATAPNPTETGSDEIETEQQIPDVRHRLDPNSSYLRALESTSFTFANPSDAIGSPPAPTDAQRAPEMDLRRQADRDGLIEYLREAGFPPHLLEALLYTRPDDISLEAGFSLISPPPALPRLAGSLIAVVAKNDLAHERAGAIARSLRIDPADITIARPTGKGSPTEVSNAVLPDAKTATIFAGGLRRDRAVVAVEHPDSRSGDVWARAVLRALRPTATWAVVDARSKRSDIERFAMAIGGVDALMVENLERSYSPCEILQGSIAIARLDGKIATAANWAGALQRSYRRSRSQRER